MSGLGCAAKTVPPTKAKIPVDQSIFSPDRVADLPAPPIAAVRPQENERHGVRWQDDYAWLRDESYPKVDDPDVLDYLKAENAYFEAAMKPQKKLTETLFEELKGRIKEDDQSVPAKDGEWLYHWRFDEGDQYRGWYRTAVNGADEVLILDENERAQGHDFYRLGAFSISPDGHLLAFSEDTNGSERYTLRFKDLRTGALLEDAIEDTIGNPQWSSDGSAVLYTPVNKEWRRYQVLTHRLGSPATEDKVIYAEKDPSFSVGIATTQSRAYFIIATGDNVTTESHLLATDDPFGKPRLVEARRQGHNYTVNHARDSLYIRTNDVHENFRIVKASPDNPSADQWQEVIAGSDTRYLRGFIPFKDVIAVQERSDAIDQILLRSYDGNEHRVSFPEEIYAASLGSNPEYDQDTLRLNYESMVTPSTVFDYRIGERKLVERKVQEIPSGYDRQNYKTKRLFATARDGERIPVSIVYRSSFAKGSDAPVHLYGYGGYGFGMTPGFSSTRLSLLDRGFAYAIAHVRGGDEKGYRWYTEGKLKKRTNTFNDFVDVTRFLIDEGFAKPGRVTISGGSAGGELMGAVLNQAPELYAACVAHVPFVDVLNTMLDDSLPLTPGEWQEWGNPIEDPEAFELIRSYSPYDNVTAQNYPPTLITGGLNDPRVTYWEPAKWAAKLRATKTDNNLLLLQTNMGAGHGGKSGRYQRLQQVAEEFTFLLMVTQGDERKSSVSG